MPVPAGHLFGEVVEVKGVGHDQIYLLVLTVVVGAVMEHILVEAEGLLASEVKRINASSNEGHIQMLILDNRYHAPVVIGLEKVHQMLSSQARALNHPQADHGNEDSVCVGSSIIHSIISGRGLDCVCKLFQNNNAILFAFIYG